VEAFDEPGGAAAKLAGECGEDLEPGCGHDGPEPQLGGRPRQPGQEECLGLVGRQAGQAGPVAVDEADAAVEASLGVDRHARFGERVDVPVDRPD